MNKITFAFRNITGQRSGRIEERWKYDTGALLLSSPIIEDIDNDGKKEILFGTKNGKIVSIDMDGKPKWTYQAEEQHSQVELMFLDTDKTNSISSTPNVADINNDGHKEIVFGTESGRAYVLDAKGKQLWTYKTDGPIRGAPFIQKFANNQTGILFGSSDKYLYFLNSKGQLLWRYNAKSEIESTPTVILSQKPLIVFGSNDGMIHALDLKGNVVWQYKTEDKILAQAVYERVSPGTEPVIIIGSTDGVLYCINEHGNLVWSYETDGAICSRASVADINNDGKKEILFGSCDNSIYALDCNGKKLWSYETDFWVVASPIIEDMDGDGKLEIIAGSYDHNIYVLDSEGTYVLDYVPGVSGIVTQTGHYGEAMTSGPGKTQGKKIWQYKTEGVVVGCAYLSGDKSIVVNTESGKINDLVHKKE
ncbi:MAG: PQQ-binding-like beta-propeller repeat protein [Candidatus Woesearchaeota archaeon]